MNPFEKAVDDLKQLYELLITGEPTPDEETEAKDEILGYLKMIQADPASEPVSEFIETAIALAEGWDVLDLWFKEVPGLTKAIISILTNLGVDVEETVAIEGAPAREEILAEESGGSQVDINSILAEVEKKYASKIEALEGKVQTLEKTVVQKDQELAGVRKTTRENTESEPATGIRPKLTPPKLHLPKIKMPPIKPTKKPFIPKFAESPAPIQTEEGAPQPPLEQIYTTPIDEDAKNTGEEKPEISLDDEFGALGEETGSSRVPKYATGETEKVNDIAGKPITIKRVNIKPVPVKSVTPNPPSSPAKIPKQIAIKAGKRKIIPPQPGSVKPISVKPVRGKNITPKFTEVKAEPEEEISAPPTPTKHVARAGKRNVVKPITLKAGHPVQVKPLGSQPVAIKSVTGKTQPPSSASTLASTLSSIGNKPPSAPPVPKTSVRPPNIGAEAVAPSINEADTELPESKTDLYSELIALEGRRFAAERSRKDIEEQFEKGQKDQAEYRNDAAQTDADLQAIAERINAIRQKLSTI